MFILECPYSGTSPAAVVIAEPRIAGAADVPAVAVAQDA